MLPNSDPPTQPCARWEVKREMGGEVWCGCGWFHAFFFLLLSLDLHRGETGSKDIRLRIPSHFTYVESGDVSTCNDWYYSHVRCQGWRHLRVNLNLWCWHHHLFCSSSNIYFLHITRNTPSIRFRRDELFPPCVQPIQEEPDDDLLSLLLQGTDPDEFDGGSRWREGHRLRPPLGKMPWCASRTSYWSFRSAFFDPLRNYDDRRSRLTDAFYEVDLSQKELAQPTWDVPPPCHLGRGRCVCCWIHHLLSHHGPWCPN